MNKQKNSKTFIAVVGYDRAMRLYVGVVPGLAGANVAAPTMEEVESGLRKLMAAYRQQTKAGGRPLPDYIGLKKIPL